MADLIEILFYDKKTNQRELYGKVRQRLGLRHVDKHHPVVRKVFRCKNRHGEVTVEVTHFYTQGTARLPLSLPELD